MRHEGNVISLSSAMDRRVAMLAPSLPLLLLRVRDKAAVYLGDRVQSLFDDADEALSEMADKSTARHEQNRYLQAMRDVRLKRKHVEHSLLDAFHQAFARLAHGEPSALLDEGLGRRRCRHWPEASVAAADAIAERTSASNGAALDHLNQRFESLIERPIDAAERNPLSPVCLCRYFVDACAEHQIERAALQVLLPLFEQWVLLGASECYARVNRMLADAGVLPALKALPAQPLAAPAAVRLVSERTCALQAAGQAYFAGLQAPLAALRGQLMSRLGQRSGAQAVSPNDLARMLSHVQRHDGWVVQGEAFDLGQELEQLLLKISARSGTRQCVGGDEEDVINLIGLLFAEVQADQNLHPRMRVLLARLHIPLLKVALLDKSVLVRVSHPARRVFNEIAAAAIGWQPEHRTSADTLYLRLEGVVQRLLDDFAEDCSVFDTHLQAFMAVSLEERRRHDLLEQRARDAEEGRVRMQQARDQVEAALNARLLGRALPVVVVDMLIGAWSQVLLTAWLKQGETSQAWSSALQTMDELLSSIAPHPQADARERLLAQVPRLLKALREGLAGIALDSVATGTFFKQLQRLHVQACAGDSVQSTEGALAWVPLERTVVLAREDEPEGDAWLKLSAQDPSFTMIQRLRIGTWIEIGAGEAVVRCRLLARIEGSDRYVFANHEGVRVREWSRTGLILAMRRGEIRVLRAGRLFERALHAAVKRLRAIPLH